MENCRTPNKEQRLKVYKKALNAIKKNEPLPQKLDECYLCIFLPMFLWGLEHYNDKAPDNETWELDEVSTIFPEFTTEHIKQIESFNEYPYNEEKKNKTRMKILKEIIKSLEK